MISLWELNFQELRRRPARAILTTLSIVIGVASLVAVAMTVHTSRTALGKMYRSLAGEADLRIESKGGGRFAQELLRQVEATAGVSAVYPLFRQYGTMYAGRRKARLLLLGVEPEKDARIRDYEIVAGRYFARADEIMLVGAHAQALAIEIGDQVRFVTRSGVLTKRVVGFLAPTESTAFNDGNVAFWQLGELQRAFHAGAQINYAFVMLQESDDLERVCSEINQALPEDVVSQPAGKQVGQARDARFAAEIGMVFAGLLSEVAMGFMILNTFLMAAGERRPSLAILRTLGASRAQILWLLLREGLLLATVGSPLGILAGYGIAVLMVVAMEAGFQTVLPSPQISGTWLVFAIAMGLGLTVISVLYPVYVSSRLTPLEGLRHDVQPPQAHRHNRWATVVGLLLVLTGTVLIGLLVMRQLPMQAAAVAAVLLIVAGACLFPLVMEYGVGWAAAVVMLFWPVTAELAREQLLRHRTRTQLTWAVLFIVITGMFALSEVLLDVISDLGAWIRETVRADYVITGTMPGMNSGDTASMSCKVGDHLVGMPGITRVVGVRFFTVEVGENRIAAIAPQFGRHEDLPLAICESLPRERVREQILQGGVVMGAIASQQLGIVPGDEIELGFAGRRHRFPVAATCSIYAMGGMAVYLDYDVAKAIFDIEGVDFYMINADPKAPAELKHELQHIADDAGVIVEDYQAFVATIDRLTSGVTASLWTLLALGFLIAMSGIMNTLMMNVLEQTQEIGMMRMIGMTREHVRQYVLAQALIYALLAIVPGLLGGCLLGLLVRATSLWTLSTAFQLLPHPAAFAAGFLALLVMIVAAAWIPARRAANVQVLSAIVCE